LAFARLRRAEIRASAGMKYRNAKMILSAEEFVSLRASDVKAEYDRATHEEALLEVWKDVLQKYPDDTVWVIHNCRIPAKTDFRHARLRPGLRQRPHRPPPHPAAPSPDKRHGRALQSLRQPSRRPNHGMLNTLVVSHAEKKRFDGQAFSEKSRQRLCQINVTDY
jgi:hypothetical protein